MPERPTDACKGFSLMVQSRDEEKISTLFCMMAGARCNTYGAENEEGHVDCWCLLDEGMRRRMVSRMVVAGLKPGMHCERTLHSTTWTQQRRLSDGRNANRQAKSVQSTTHHSAHVEQDPRYS